LDSKTLPKIRQHRRIPVPFTPTRDRIDPEKIETPPRRRPDWIKVRAPGGETYERLHELMRSKSLHTVCEEAMCPNLGECWGSGTATFLMLGDVCTRSCGFCDIKRGQPSPLDWLEPERVAQAVKDMQLKHAVTTSVNRDDRVDGGAPIFAMVIRRIRQLHPGCSIEVLIPDFKGSLEALKIVMDARPEILNHNVETAPPLFKRVQPQDRYEWAAATLSNAKKLDPEVLTKSGIMVGLGESLEEVKEVMRDQRSWGVDILTVGQYLQPSKQHLPIECCFMPQEFEEIKEYGLDIGFKWVESGPLVRSSYHAAKQVRLLSLVHCQLYGGSPPADLERFIKPGTIFPIYVERLAPLAGATTHLLGSRRPQVGGPAPLAGRNHTAPLAGRHHLYLNN
jgi:lipoic acid synthetase